jgi:hypothetical protein
MLVMVFAPYHHALMRYPVRAARKRCSEPQLGQLGGFQRMRMSQVFIDFQRKSGPLLPIFTQAAALDAAFCTALLHIGAFFSLTSATARQSMIGACWVALGP